MKILAFKEGDNIPKNSRFLRAEERIVSYEKVADEHPWHDTYYYDVPVFGTVYLYEVEE